MRMVWGLDPTPVSLLTPQKLLFSNGWPDKWQDGCIYVISMWLLGHYWLVDLN